MVPEPQKKYVPFLPLQFDARTWPTKTIHSAPIWCSVDLRDGNQALRQPMNLQEKLKVFHHLLEIGFKEIEVGFPAASRVEYEFVRKLIKEGHIPKDVSIQVITQARKELIQTTMDSIAGAHHTIVHLYNSTSELQRRVVFKKSKQEIQDIATQGVVWIQQAMTKQHSVSLQYSPESFTGTELEFARDVCDAVIQQWNRNDKTIINLPATVELFTPNVYADSIEWFANNLQLREKATISIHPHNDRGTAVAAAELALLAGAERIEGTLFGNGERTGNVDLVTLALNLYTQGISPKLDFSDLPKSKKIMQETNKLGIPERQPYAGELVFTAFSGSHQDAIHKGFIAYHAKDRESPWEIPYLPIDPADIGREYEPIIRINSQSGKGLLSASTMAL
ncbi:MAG: 2-isopropylmalate synthase [Spirochaetota bacterium]